MHEGRAFGWRIILLWFIKVLWINEWYIRLIKGDSVDACSFIQHIKIKVSYVFQGNHYVNKLVNLIFTF